MINVAIIGCGAIARVRHAPEYRANARCRLYGLFDPDQRRARQLAEDFGGKVYDSLDELLEEAQIDAVSVCTSNETHASVTLRALSCGKHVLCEKPMATRSIDAQQMTQAARASGKILMIGHNQRLTPAHALAKQVLDQGEMGRVLSFQTTFSHGGPEAWLNAKSAQNVWFYDPKRAPMGVLSDLGIHKIDLICYLLSDEVVQTHAFTATRDKRMDDGRPIPVEDNAAVVLRMRSGAIGTLLTSWTAYGAEDNSTVLNCEKGILRIYQGDTQLRVIRPDGTITDHQPGSMQTNANQSASGVIDLFIEGILRGVSPIPGEDGLRALRVIEACASEK